MKERGLEVKTESGADTIDNRLYVLDVFIISGPVTEEFVTKNKVISRTIEIRGDQTLEDLHNAIFRAFDREEQHMYEFQFGRGPYSPDGRVYILPAALGSSGAKIAGYATRTTIGSLNLKVGHAFGYCFDFGDEWIHRINVVSIGDEAPPGEYPRVAKRVGESPPQYAEWDNEGG
ncbi:MAG: hypothetical protein AB1742_14000 [bacterium]